jgi:hypothetical protein
MIEVGTKIRIIYMQGEPHYSGREGYVTLVDSIGQLHGTWGGLAVDLSVDEIEVIE